MIRSVRFPASGARRGFFVLALAGWSAAGLAAPSVTLLVDNFNAATPNVNDLNVDLARQTGAAAPLSYTMAFGPGHYGHQLQNPNAPNQLLLADFANSTVSPNLNFAGPFSAGGLRISFDLDSVPTVYGGTPDNWGCINLGLLQAHQLANVNQGVPHFGVLFRANGFLQAFDGASVVGAPQYSTQPPGTTNHIDIEITDTDGNPFDGVGDATISIFANGSPTPAYTFTKVGGYAGNYINFQGSFRAHLDNLIVTKLGNLATPTLNNPSFEADTFTVFPGYVSDNGPITGWSSLGNHGVNPGTFGSPFADNGAIPDGTKVAFMQGDGALRQTVGGFTRGGIYRLRYFENARNGPQPGSFASVGGIVVVPQHSVPQVGGANPYTTVLSQPFVAHSSSLEVAITKNNPNGGDTTLLVDNVTVELALPTAPLVMNPSFEADTFNTFPGYASGNGPITGWSPAVDRVGLNGAGMGAGTAFADNGTIPDGTKICFIQGQGASSNISQFIGPFTVGSAYVVRYAENARNCCGGVANNTVRINSTVIDAMHSVTAVGGANPYIMRTSSAFVATSPFMQLSFMKGETAPGDSTLLLDAIGVLAAPTLITQQPVSTCAQPGQNITLTVAAVGPPPLTYQWRKNGVPIPDATNASLTISNATEADTGGYSVVVTSGAGTVTSVTAKVVVGQLISSLYGTGTDNDGVLLPGGAVDPHYTLHASADAGFPGPNAIVLSEAFPIPPWLANGPVSKWIAPNNSSGSAQPGDYTYRLTFNLSNYDPANTVLCGQWATDNSGVNIFINGTPTGQTVSGFGAFATFVVDSGFVAGLNTLDFVVNNAAPAGPTGLRVNLTGVSIPGAGIAPTIARQPQDTLGIIGNTVTFTAQAAGSTPLSYQWYHGAALISGATNPSLSFTVTGAADQGLYSVEVTNAHGTVTSREATLTVRLRVPGLFNTGVDNSGVALADGMVDSHYQIIVNPDSASPDAIVQDGNAFPIVGAGPWLANNSSGKWIGPRFNTAGAAGLATGGGIYVYRIGFDLTGMDVNTVNITGGWATDNPGMEIRVNGANTGSAGSPGFSALTSFNLSIANSPFVAGPNTLEFVVRNDDPVAGYTGLRVANLIGLATLPSTPPSIATQPQGGVAGTGESFTFTVGASGSSPLSYQWRKGGTDITDATNLSLTLNNLTHADAANYSVVVSNPFGTATSSNATLVVRDSISGFFNTGVDDARVALADGVVDPHYRLVVNPDSASPDAIVEDSTVFPIVAGPWVANDVAGKWIGPRQETSAAAGGDYTYRITVDMTGFDPAGIVLTGEWATDNGGLDILVNGVSNGQVNSVQFTGYTPFRLTNGFLPGPNFIDFRVNNAAVGYTGLRVRNFRGLGDLLPPGTAPFIVQQPQSMLANFGDTVTFLVRANGSLPLTYQWFYEGIEILDATNATYSVFVDAPDLAGSYSVEIANGSGSVTSTDAELTVNNPPTVPAKGGATTQDTPFTFLASKLLHGVTDPDGDPFSFDSVASTSAQGGTIVPGGGGFIYTPPVGFSGTDTFEFFIRDSRGGIGIGIMEMFVASGALPSPNQVSVAMVPGGFRVRFAGIPGQSYRIQRSEDLVAWTTLATRTVPAHGIIEYVDVTLLPAAFYRTQAAP